MKVFLFLHAVCLLLLLSCTQERPTIGVERLFTALPDNYTDLTFENKLVDEAQFNVYKYRNYYNGGGVAIGDLNNDGLPDVYMSANQESNKLFLNEGEFQFKDITRSAGVSGTHNWSTGVCMVDINGDRWLDIYVCNSGNIAGDNRANELFLNQGATEDGVPRFEEVAAEYGADDRGFSTHAAFFDFDRDGDLDLYVLNNAFRAINSFDLSNNLRHERDATGGDRFYRNDAGTFVDISAEAGIYGSVIGFGLGVSVSDLNNDGWLDIYVANDFFERDYIYLNNRNGGFDEKLEDMIRHTSMSSMGADIADLNNDGFMDICATDMLPEDDQRLKTTFTFDVFESNQKMLDWGYYHQLSQNVLQLNRGFDSQRNVSFSEIGLLAGVAKTDWSWGANIVDLDNDGLKDIFVANGVFRDVTDQDYLMEMMQAENIREILRGDGVDFSELIKRLPSTKLRNYAFRNTGDLIFSNQAAEWGLDTLSFSSGVAYGDLDGDGDNDLVINNVNHPSFVYRNEADSLTDNHYLKVKLVGQEQNSFAIGAKVTLKCDGERILVQEQIPMRGFQSSVDYVLTFGLGEIVSVDSLIVDWPDGRRSRELNIPADQLITLDQEEGSLRRPGRSVVSTPLFRDVTERFPVQYRHVENEFNDFQREPFIPHQLSTQGPRIAKGDVNGDGLEDLYLGGAKASSGKLLQQMKSGEFKSSDGAVFEKAKISEDVDAEFFDADGDRDLDLYVVSGGNEFSTRSPGLLDRLYLNDGKGRFSQSVDALPGLYASGSCVTAGDYDRDGDLDLFVGSRSIPWKYGLTPASYLLANDGSGKFSVVTDEVAPDLAKTGMVTDAQWVDQDKDGDLDLVVVGEWMPVTLFRNTGGGLVNVTAEVALDGSNGWWNCLEVTDLNNDGHLDLVAGNLGKNSKLQASESEPVSIYLSDFDRNGVLEQILCYYKLGKSYPMALRPDLVRQLPFLEQKFPRHADYAGKQITEIFSEAQLRQATVKQAYTFATSVFYGSAEGTFRREDLPLAAQVSPTYAVLARDVDQDGTQDLLLAGNFFGVKPQLGRYDASYGVVLTTDGAGTFVPHSPMSSGLALTGEVRDMIPLSRQNEREVILVAKNNDRMQVLTVRPR